jgi:pilus assembly protein CpaB
VTLSVNDVSGVGGFIKAGDYVDVIVTFDQNEVGDNVSHVVLQNILVLASSRENNGNAVENSGKEKKDAAKGNTVTLAVSPEEAAYIALMDEKGKVRMALRPYMPSNGLVLTNTVTPKDIVGVQVSPVQNKQVAGASAKTSNEPPPSYRRSDIEPKETKTQPEGGIQTIRGTKVETVPVH